MGPTRRKGRPEVVKAARNISREIEATRQRESDPKEWARLMIAQNVAHAATATLEPAAWLAAEWAAGFSANARAWEWILARNPTSLPGFDQAAKLPEMESQVQLFRDIVGNPFHTTAVDPSWRTAAVVGLARGILEELAFDRMPVLADALEDADCCDADLLAHCRGEGPHVRGCWVVDAVLLKK
ncbi:MAG: hypothetical protein U0804_23220 [Gemmataceae bacterium]